MAPQGLYSVQKSRSFGGVNKQSDSSFTKEPGQRTPNFDSLRKKFSKKKTISFDDEGGDYVDGTTSTLKKRTKGVSRVGNILKWFKRDNSNNNKEQQYQDQESLTPKIRRLVQKQSKGSKFVPFRSSSCDSICSLGSAASSFAFVPVEAYKIGRYVESNKKIAIGINCGQETYRRRIEQRANCLENDKELTLKTKYNLISSDSPPRSKRSGDLQGSALPNGPLLALSELHRNDDTNSSSSDSDTVELESISQRGSPSRQWSGPWAESGQASADQQRVNKNNRTAAADKNESPVQSIKPRELRGQLLYPATIRVSDDQRRNCPGQESRDPDTGAVTLTRQGTKVAPSQPANNLLKTSELLPKKSAESEECSVFHYSEIEPSNTSPETVSPSRTLFTSPNTTHSKEISTDPDVKPLRHIPGKRRAPEAPPPPARSLSPVSRKKGPAPPPPTEGGGLVGRVPGPGSHVLAAGQTQLCRSSTAVTVGRQTIRMTGSAPTSPALSRKQTANDWVIQDGVLRSAKESKTHLPDFLDQEKEVKEVKTPLSPKPWYKRNLVKDSSEKKNKNQKAKSPENLPDIHTSRKGINPSEGQDSQQMILRTKLRTGQSSPKPDRPNSRPISGLTGISELDKQAAEIIKRKRNEEEKARDERFYTDVVEKEGMEARKAIEEIMENVSKKMTRLEGISKNNHHWDEVLERTKPSEPCLISPVEKTGQSSCNKNVSSDIEQDFQSMGSVISDLNSFLASTRKALSSPLSHKRSEGPGQVSEAAIRKLLTRLEADNNKDPPQVRATRDKPEKCDSGNSMTGELSDPDQKLNYFPPSSLSRLSKPATLDYNSNLPPSPPPGPPPPPPTQRTAEWSCDRCTLINLPASLNCEACGARREEFQQEEAEMDTEGQEAPPKVGNVLDKLVLFSSIDAKARETPSLQRRKTDSNKLVRTYSSALLPIDEKPLLKTLERISVQQAELAKTKDCFNNNFLISKDANFSQFKPDSNHERIPPNQVAISQQQEKPEESKNNSLPRKTAEYSTSTEGTLPKPDPNPPNNSSKDECVEKIPDFKEEVPSIVTPVRSSLVPPAISSGETDTTDRPQTSASKIFDFTKTPRSFLSSSAISQPTPKPWSKFCHNERKVSQVTAPKMNQESQETKSTASDDRKMSQESQMTALNDRNMSQGDQVIIQNESKKMSQGSQETKIIPSNDRKISQGSQVTAPKISQGIKEGQVKAPDDKRSQETAPKMSQGSNQNQVKHQDDKRMSQRSQETAPKMSQGTHENQVKPPDDRKMSQRSQESGIRASNDRKMSQDSQVTALDRNMIQESQVMALNRIQENQNPKHIQGSKVSASKVSQERPVTASKMVQENQMTNPRMIQEMVQGNQMTNSRMIQEMVQGNKVTAPKVYPVTTAGSERRETSAGSSRVKPGHEVDNTAASFVKIRAN